MTAKPFSLASFVPPARSKQAEREVGHDSPLRRCRTCYGHLAGVEGVALLDGMLELGWMVLAGDPNELHPRLLPTERGEEALKRRGINLEQTRRAERKLAYGCTDWTERRFHLGGALGSAVTDVLNGQGIVRRREGSQVVAVEQPVLDWLG
jgi:hypothetical protein